MLDRTNVRDLTPDAVGGAADLVVGDLSFISLAMVLPALAAVVDPDADLVLMVKPQFEVGKERLGKGGVVRDPELRVEAVVDVAARGRSLGLGVPRRLREPAARPGGQRRVLRLAPAWRAGRRPRAVDRRRRRSAVRGWTA